MGKHDRTLKEIFHEPTLANIKWRDIEGLLKHAGAQLSEGRGSRVRVSLNGVLAVFHRPHPGNETTRPVVRSVRRFLTEAGVMP